MKIKKIVFTALVLILALSLMASNTYLIKVGRVKRGQSVELIYGRAGISFIKSQFTGTVRMNRISGGNAPGEERPLFVQKLFDVRLTDNKGNRVTHVVGAVYVYFKVRQREVRMWEDGTLTIYYFDTWKNEWVECPTVQLVDALDGTRLSCRIRIFGLYGLGSK